MTYDRHYRDTDRKKNDTQAIKDIKEYFNEATWETLLVEAGRVEQIGTAKAFQQLNIAMSFCGIRGYPVHAFGRKYCRSAYRAWMHEEPDPILTDEEGFRIVPLED